MPICITTRGNNPVKYTDPDGKEQFSPFTNRSDFWGFLFGSTSGSDKIASGTLASISGNENTTMQLNALSPLMGEAMAKLTGDAIIGGMEFMSENGTSLALVAYASGQVEVGAVIDGITVACDITLAYLEVNNTGDYKKFAKLVASDVVSTAVGYGVSIKAAKTYAKAFNNLPDSLTAKAIDSVSNILGEYASSSANTTTGTIADEVLK